jgi:formylglycine-generating enzyme required for sulfatase activity/serine/threonine protein kinase
MPSRGQNPSRTPEEQPNRPPLSEIDASFSATNDSKNSRDAAGNPEASDVSDSAIDWFPKAPRYKRLNAPITGGMGIVFQALDVNLDIQVAIKRIRPEYALDNDLISRFEREARLQVRLRHPNLVHVRDYATDSFGPFIVMDWIDGESLATLIEQSGPMEWKLAAVLIRKIADALQIAHEAGIIHRDVKPANILLDSRGEPFVTDFGLARIEATQSALTETATNAMLGTVNYASPEQQRNPRAACFQSDIWSLGATLYKIVTGFDVLAMRESLIPEPLRPIVLKATEHAIDARYDTMRQMSLALQAVLETPGSDSFEQNISEKQSSTSSTLNVASNESDLATMWRQTQLRVEQTHAEAKETAEEYYDYARAVQILETIPDHLRKTHLFEKLVRRRDRVEELDAVVRSCVSQFRTKGLKDAINELLTLQPGRQDLRKLLGQLPPDPPASRPSVPSPSTPRSLERSPGTPQARNRNPAVSLPLQKVNRNSTTMPRLGRRLWLFGIGGSLAAVGGAVLHKLVIPTVEIPTPDAPDSTEATVPPAVKIEPLHVQPHEPAQTVPRPALLVAPFTRAQAQESQEAWARYLGIEVEITDEIGMKLRIVPPGTFDMGSPISESGRSYDELQRRVTITEPKLVGVYPVTQGEWKKVMGRNSSYFTSVAGQDTNRFPVEQLSYNECLDFLERINVSYTMKGWRYRLPTEAEWEYACRAGTVTPYWFGSELNGSQANCDGSNPYKAGNGLYLKRASVVGSYGANPFGLYDQHGNVWEWCKDCYGSYETSISYDPTGSHDPTGPTSGSTRVVRGGSWQCVANNCRSAYRRPFGHSLRDINVGFRVVCELR